MRGNQAVLHDFLFVINIVEKKIQGSDSLRQAAFDKLPLRRRDDARHKIKRENPFRSARISIDIEGHALAEESAVDRLLLLHKLFGSQRLKDIAKACVVRRNFTVGAENFVEIFFWLVVIEHYAVNFGQSDNLRQDIYTNSICLECKSINGVLAAAVPKHPIKQARRLFSRRVLMGNIVHSPVFFQRPPNLFIS